MGSVEILNVLRRSCLFSDLTCGVECVSCLPAEQPRWIQRVKWLEKTAKVSNYTQLSVCLSAAGVVLGGPVVPAGGGRRRCQRTGCSLGARQGIGRPSVWGKGPAPSSGAGGRPSSPIVLTFHPEAPPARKRHRRPFISHQRPAGRDDRTMRATVCPQCSAGSVRTTRCSMTFLHLSSHSHKNSHKKLRSNKTNS